MFKQISLTRTGYLGDIVIFALVFFALNGVFCHHFKTRVAHKTQELNREGFYSNLAKNQIIALGDSHMVVLLNPHIINDLYNFANMGENYAHVYYRLKKQLSNQNHKIHTAILQMDPHCFFMEFLLSQNLYFMKDIYDSWELGLDLERPIFVTIYYKVIAGLACYTSGLKKYLGALYKNETNKHSYRGYAPLAINKQLTQNLLRRKLRQHFDHQELSPLMKLYFEKLIKLLKEHHIKVILLACPLSDDYYKIIPSNLLDKYLKYRDSILTKHPDICFVDYHDALSTKREDMGIYFSDFDHVNTNGSRIISERLKEEYLFK